MLREMIISAKRASGQASQNAFALQIGRSYYHSYSNLMLITTARETLSNYPSPKM
jgi:hypothetical protein